MRPMRICGISIAVLLLGTAAFWLMRHTIAQERRFVAAAEANSPFRPDEVETTEGSIAAKANVVDAPPARPDAAAKRMAQAEVPAPGAVAEKVGTPTNLPPTAKDEVAVPKPTSVPETTAPESDFTKEMWAKLKITRQIFSVTWLEAEDAAKTLRSLYLDEANGQGVVRIASNTSSNTIIVNAPADSLKEIEATLKLLEEKAEQKAKSLNAQRLTLHPIDKQDAKFESDARLLAAQVRAAQGADRDKLRRELEVITEKHLEHRQQHRKQEIDALAKRVDQMRESHTRRSEQKAEIIKRRIAELLNEDQGHWDETRAALSKSVDKKSDSKKEEKILAELEKPVTFDFTNESLDGVCKAIMAVHGFDIVIDKVKLEENSVASDATDITLQVSEIKLKNALKLLLDAKNLTFVVENEVLKITTKPGTSSN